MIVLNMGFQFFKTVKQETKNDNCNWYIQEMYNLGLQTYAMIYRIELNVFVMATYTHLIKFEWNSFRSE